MTKRKAKPMRYRVPAPSSEERAALAREVAAWDGRRQAPTGFVDAPEALPRAGEATAISLRMPVALLAILRRFAEREGIGYQVLIKQWLDDRVRAERDLLRRERESPALAPTFPLVDHAGRDSRQFDRG